MTKIMNTSDMVVFDPNESSIEGKTAREMICGWKRKEGSSSCACGQEGYFQEEVL